jgi:hypothetical protein
MQVCHERRFKKFEPVASQKILWTSAFWEICGSDQVSSLFVQRLLKELNLKAHIRRFRNVSGCKLPRDDDQLIRINFGDIPDSLNERSCFIACRADRFAILDHDLIAWSFRDVHPWALHIYPELVNVAFKVFIFSVWVCVPIWKSHQLRTSNLGLNG